MRHEWIDSREGPDVIADIKSMIAGCRGPGGHV
jgi:hypothetical protein